jgi:release factor glutamine methyltransferase
VETVAEARRWAISELVRLGSEEAATEADWLLAHLLGRRRAELPLYRHQPLTRAQQEALREALARRSRREPLAYILGTQEFMGLSFLVDARVLVPRPETEVLVEQALARWQPHQTRWTDVGTGSGAVAISLAVHLPTVQVVAVDLSPAALDVARANARRHGVAGRVHPVAGSLLAPVRPLEAGGGVDGILANLPYIPSAVVDTLQPEVSRWEPRRALDGGPDGLDLYRRLFPQVPARLRPGGWILCEFGPGQAEAMRQLARQTPGLGGVEIVLDYSGHERILVAQRQA